MIDFAQRFMYAGSGAAGGKTDDGSRQVPYHISNAGSGDVISSTYASQLFTAIVSFTMF